MRIASVVLVSLLFGSGARAQEPAPSPDPGEAILKQLKETPIPFTADLPAGVPSPESWGGYTGQLALSVEHIKSGKEDKHLLALVLVQGGVCVENDTDVCYLGARYELSAIIDRIKQTRQLVHRYAFVSNTGKRLEGLMYGTENATAGDYSYWVRTGSAWTKRQAATHEYDIDDAFLEWFVESVKRLGGNNTPRPKATPKPGIRTVAAW